MGEESHDGRAALRGRWDFERFVVAEVNVGLGVGALLEALPRGWWVPR